MESVSRLAEFDFAWKQQYRMLAKEFARVLPKSGIIVEIGCGEGQLTIPLARLVRSRFVTVDSYAWPYATGYRSLLSKLSREKLKRQISLVKGDYRNFLSAQKEDLFEGVISSEFLPEIDSKQTPAFLSECHRILKPDGIAVCTHFFRPFPRVRGKVSSSKPIQIRSGRRLRLKSGSLQPRTW